MKKIFAPYEKIFVSASLLAAFSTVILFLLPMDIQVKINIQLGILFFELIVMYAYGFYTMFRHDREHYVLTREDVEEIVERIIDVRFPQTAGAGLGR